jgi:alpha-L-arabinofuranosidase
MREPIGSHVVRNNTIYNCGAAGICGSMGGTFSQVIGNHIYNINIDQAFTGHEMTGIKLHAPIDTLIGNNRIHHTSRGIGLDWMTQGTRVCANLLYDNGREDLYIEVNHGPYMVDNNIFLTSNTLKDHSQGGSYAHNLFAGKIDSRPNERETPYHKAHSTEIAGLSSIRGGDNRFYNNIMTGAGLDVYSQSGLPCSAHGNVYLRDAQALAGEEGQVSLSTFDAAITVTEENDSVFLHIKLPEVIKDQQNKLVTSKLLGKASVSGASFVNPDGSPLVIASDYFGQTRNKENPSAGPFEWTGQGDLRLKVWQGNP